MRSANKFQSFREAILPPAKPDIVDWCEANRTLSGAHAGPWRRDWCKWAIEIMRAAVDRRTRVVIVRGASQIAKTESLILNVWAYRTVFDPAPAMMVLIRRFNSAGLPRHYLPTVSRAFLKVTNNPTQAPDDPFADLRLETEGPDWLKTLEVAVIHGEQLCQVQLPPRQIILSEWFNEGDCGFIFAPRGLGKTWMNLGLAIAIATKGKFGPYESPADWPVLYLDGEMPFDVMRQRILALNGSVPENFHFLSHELLFQRQEATLNLARCELQEALIKFCLARGIRVVILDNLSCLFGGIKENDADAWEPIKLWLLTLRRHRIAAVVVHHSGRNPNYMRGTSRREDDVFWIMRLEEVADAKITRGVGARFITRFTKNRGAPSEPLAYDWRVEPKGNDKVRVSFVEASSDDILVRWVHDGLTSATDIANEMGVSKGAISQRAARLIDAGRLQKNGREYTLGPVEQSDGHGQRNWTE